MTTRISAPPRVAPNSPAMDSVVPGSTPVRKVELADDIKDELRGQKNVRLSSEFEKGSDRGRKPKEPPAWAQGTSNSFNNARASRSGPRDCNGGKVDSFSKKEPRKERDFAEEHSRESMYRYSEFEMEMAAVASGMPGIDLEDEVVDSGVNSSAFAMARVTKMRSEHYQARETRLSKRAGFSQRSSTEIRTSEARTLEKRLSETEADEEEDEEASFATKRKSDIFANKLEDLETRLRHSNNTRRSVGRRGKAGLPSLASLPRRMSIARRFSVRGEIDEDARPKEQGADESTDAWWKRSASRMKSEISKAEDDVATGKASGLNRPARRNSLVALMRGSIAPRPETTPTASRVEAPAAPKVETPHTSTALRRDSAGRIDGQTLLAGVGSMFSKPGGRSQGSKLGSCKSLLASAMSVRSPSQRGE